MQAVRVVVTRRREYQAGDTFNVFGDRGTGTIDFTTPLLDRPVAFWPEATRSDGHLLDGHASARHLDSVDPDGHLDDLHLVDDHLWPAAPRTVETPAHMFGSFLHAVKTFDALGNAKAEAPPVLGTVINSSPTPPRQLAKGIYDGGTDQMSFTFAGSDELISA